MDDRRQLLQYAATDKLPLVKCSYCSRPLLFTMRARHLQVCSVIGPTATKARDKHTNFGAKALDTVSHLTGHSAVAEKAPPKSLSAANYLPNLGLAVNEEAQPSTSLEVAPVAKPVRKRKRKEPSAAVSALDTAELLSGADNVSIASASSSATKVRQKKSKLKVPYDPEIHCGVQNTDTSEPCTRAITCKMHTVKAKRLVDRRDASYDALVKSYQLHQQRSRHGNSLNSPRTAGADANSPTLGVLGLSSLALHPLLGNGVLQQSDLAPFGTVSGDGTLLPIPSGQLVSSEFAVDLGGELNDAAVAVKLMCNVGNSKLIFETRDGRNMANQIVSLLCDPTTGHLDPTLIRSLPSESQKLLIVHFASLDITSAKDPWKLPALAPATVSRKLKAMGVERFLALILREKPAFVPNQRFGVSQSGRATIAGDGKSNKYIKYLCKSYPESELMLRAIERHEPLPLAVPPGFAGVASLASITGLGKSGIAFPSLADAGYRRQHTSNVSSAKDSLDALSKHLFTSEHVVAQKKSLQAGKSLAAAEVADSPLAPSAGAASCNGQNSPGTASDVPAASAIAVSKSQTSRIPEISVPGNNWWKKCTSRGALSEMLRAQRNSIRT